MMTVIRRSMSVLVLSVLLSACGGLGPDDAFRTDAESVSYEQLVDFTTALVDPSTEEGATVDANALRAAGGLWITTAAEVEALAEIGVTMSADDALVAEQQLALAIANNQLGPIDPSSPAYDAVVDFAWTRVDPDAANVLQADPNIRERIVALLGDDVETASELGAWDPSLLQFVGPAAAG